MSNPREKIVHDHANVNSQGGSRFTDTSDIPPTNAQVNPNAKVKTKADADPLFPYRLGRRLGQGGIGSVYEAWDVDNNPVAVKMLHLSYRMSEDACCRFAAEAQIMQKFKMLPNIAKIYSFGESAAYGPYLVMEQIQGQTLQERRDQNRDQLPELISFVEVLARAVAGIHKLGTVHRDIKSSNIIIDDQLNSYKKSSVYLIDFGLAKILDDADSSLLVPELNILKQGPEGVGTLDYLAPEQARSDTTNRKTDIFAIGGVLYWLLTGFAPCSKIDPYDIASGDYYLEILKHLNQTQSATGLINLIKQCLAFDPEDRPTSAQVVADELAAWLLSQKKQ